MLAVTVSGRLPTVPVEVAGAVLPFVLDTGAQWTVISAAAAAALGLPPDPARSSASHGLSGRSPGWVRDAVAPSMSVGALRLGAVALHVAELPPGIVGVLGLDVIAQYDLDLDMPGLTARLMRAEGCEGDFVAWARPHGRHPSVGPAGGRMGLPAALSGRAVRAMVDTGAAASLVGGEAAAMAGGGEAAGAAGAVMDATGVLVAVAPRSFASLRIGDEEFRPASVAVCGCAIPGADLQVGQDWLATRRVWFSWSSSQMFVERPR